MGRLLEHPRNPKAEIRDYTHLKVEELRLFHVQEWIDKMDVANDTKRNYGRSIKRCIQWAKKQGHIDSNSIADLELPRGGKREMLVSEGEWATILELAPHRCFSDLLIVTWETGGRPQESLIVEARHVDVVNQRWVFSESESKTDIPRVVYLTESGCVSDEVGESGFDPVPFPRDIQPSNPQGLPD